MERCGSEPALTKQNDDARRAQIAPVVERSPDRATADLMTSGIGDLRSAQ